MFFTEVLSFQASEDPQSPRGVLGFLLQKCSTWVIFCRTSSQNEKGMDMKVEVKEEEEERYGMNYQQTMEKVEMTTTTKQEESSSGDLGENAVKEEIKKEDEEYGVVTEPSEGHSESGNLMKNNNVKEECKEEDEEYGVMEISEAHKELYQDREEEVDIKDEVKEEEEETHVMDYQQSTEEVGMRAEMKQEEPSLDTITVHGRDVVKISEDCIMLSSEDEDITQYGPGEDHNVHQGPHSADGPSYSSNPEGPQTGRGGAALPTDRRFFCPECGKYFSLKSSLNEHMRCHTGSLSYFCTECGRRYATLLQLVTHEKVHRGEKPYSCPTCGRCFFTKSDLDIHQCLNTVDKPFSCPQCGKGFSRKYSLKIHRRSHTGQKTYTCSECGKCYLRKTNFIKHQKFHTGFLVDFGPPERCPRPLYSRDSAREDHMSAHDQVGGTDHLEHEGDPTLRHMKEMGDTYMMRLSAVLVGRGLKAHSVLIQPTLSPVSHFITTHTACSPTIFGFETFAQKVMMVHGRDVVKISEDCIMLSSEDEDITQYGPGEDHNVHQGPHSADGPSYSSNPEGPQTGRGGAALPTDRRFFCPECGKYFSLKSSLNEHMRCHTGSLSYFCTECGRRYATLLQLVTHEKVHRGEKPYSCPTCGRCFFTKSDLDIHQCLNTVDKPFSCPQCGKGFSRKYSLKIHRRSHTGQKTYTCSECGKCYLRKTNFIKHQKFHTGEIPQS
ncbi:PREDICTED: zinc finger protein 567-like [Nanorana parkeri]|uniref:zinc finger protein 567-like n=1 Tax=Nanorana parkeri TaxID=125878 RepID=UPI0008540299|nr:PREDICTED: zinc finger protein 567-like [Nanorana parkeri]